MVSPRREQCEVAQHEEMGSSPGDGQQEQQATNAQCHVAHPADTQIEGAASSTTGMAGGIAQEVGSSQVYRIQADEDAAPASTGADPDDGRKGQVPMVEESSCIVPPQIGSSGGCIAQQQRGHAQETFHLGSFVPVRMINRDELAGGQPELWEQLLEADLSTGNNGGRILDMEKQAAPETLQHVPHNEAHNVFSPVASVPATATNPFLGNGEVREALLFQKEPEPWKAFATDEDVGAVINPFIGSEGFRASKVDESDIKPHVALQALFQSDVKRDDIPTAARVRQAAAAAGEVRKSSKWRSFICV